jgi:ABC-2 type transport system ATP-binding protein
VTGAIGPLIAALAGQPVASLKSHEPSLEEIFLQRYERSDPGVGQ